MKASAFDYAAPVTVDETLALLDQHGDEATILAGGQSLVPLLALRLANPELLVDINRVADLAGVEHRDGQVEIGSLVRHSALVTAGSDADAVPLLQLAAPHIGHFQIRNRGTVCGSLTHADAAAEWPLVAVTLDAGIELRGAAGSRDVPAREFFVGPFATARESTELVTSVRFPVWTPHAGFAIQEFARRSGDFAIAGSACGVEVSAGHVTRCAIGLLGLASVPLRAGEAERALFGATAADVDVDEIARIATADTDPPTDIHASGRYRRRIGAAMVAAALARALSEAHDV